MYFIDNGYLQTFFISKNMSRKFENTIACNLFFSGKSLFYFRNAMEIDFVIEEKIPLQASYKLSEMTTLQREINGLIKFLQFAGGDVGYLLTWNESDSVEQNGKKIKIIPAWYFLLFDAET